MQNSSSVLKTKRPKLPFIAVGFNLKLKVDLRFLHHVIWISQHWPAQVPNDPETRMGVSNTRLEINYQGA